MKFEFDVLSINQYFLLHLVFNLDEILKKLRLIFPNFLSTFL